MHYLSESMFFFCISVNLLVNTVQARRNGYTDDELICNMLEIWYICMI